MKSQSNPFAVKVSEILKRLSIPEAGRDKHGNLFVAAEYLPRLPATLQANYQKRGCFRICLKSS